MDQSIQHFFQINKEQHHTCKEKSKCPPPLQKMCCVLNHYHIIRILKETGIQVIATLITAMAVQIINLRCNDPFTTCLLQREAFTVSN